MGVYHKEYAQELAEILNIKVNMLFIDRQMLSKPIHYLSMKKNIILQEKNYQVYIKRILDYEKISYDLALKNYVQKLDKAFKRYLKNNPKPDVIQVMVSLPAGYAACILGKKYNIPVVITEHASYFKEFFSGTKKKYGDFILENSYFTTVSEFMAQDIRKLGYKCEVIPNMVNVDLFKGQRKPIKELRILIVSAFRKGKKIQTAIEALKIIIEKEKIDAKLTIVGTGLGNYYQNKCHELEMDNYVNFVGQKSKEEIVEILKKHNMLVITSEFETFGIPGIEALASGIPVVSTRCHGPEEYIDDSCGKLVAIENAQEMAQAILEVYHNLDKYDPNYLRSIADQYSNKNVISKAVKIYKELMKKN